MKLQHFIWWVAGADKEKLEKCPADQKRMGAIGMVIMTTSLVAFIAGTVAALFFTQKGTDETGKLGWSLAFGVLWMIIIFMIDRSLVVTMKKNPKKKHPNRALIGPFLFRMVLAVIIALMMSIPLELYIFRDFISNNRDDFSLIEIERTKNNNEVAMGKSGLKGERDKQEAQFARDSSEYQRVSEEIKIIRDSIERKNNKIKRLQDDNNQYWIRINHLKSDTTSNHDNEISRVERKIKSNKTIIKDLNAEIDSYNKQINEKEKPLSDAYKRMMEDQGRIDYYSDRISEIDNISDTLQKRRGTIQNNSGRFFRDYQILNNMISKRDEETGKLLNPNELLFFWLIRIIFFLIELLPTLVKVITPVGEYDSLAYEEEEALKNYFSSEEFHIKIKQKQEALFQHDIDVQKDQNEIDRNTRRDMLEQMGQTQKEVAEKYIMKWKQEKLDELLAKPHTIETLPVPEERFEQA